MIDEVSKCSVEELAGELQQEFVSHKYFGVETPRNPLDHWAYQQIIWETKPDLLIEVGVFHGGQTLALAHMFDAMGHGKVVGIDVDLSGVPQIVKNHPRIELIEAPGAEPSVVELFRKIALSKARIMVIEDSSHTYDNTLAVLRAYAPIVSVGCYLICEDSVCWHPLQTGPWPGPYEAIGEFIKGRDDFKINRFIEPLLSWNPKGYLLRTK
jgi:cephalosporin hydroxylase